MKVYYARCSTEEQNIARQTKLADELKVDKIYIEKVSGKNADRKKLKEMLSFVREGDTVICSDISRIARNTKDLLNIVEELQKKNVEFISIKEHIDTTTPQGKFMLTIFGAMAELERETILQRQREGIEIAKAEGKYKGRQPLQIDEKKMKEVCHRWRNGDITAVKAQKELGLASRTFYRKVQEMGL
jgi:DNA invertase Pin-like site-specific DNA recombinase